MGFLKFEMQSSWLIGVYNILVWFHQFFVIKIFEMNFVILDVTFYLFFLKLIMLYLDFF